MSKEDFRVGLAGVTGGEVCYQRRTKGENKGRWVFDGLTFANGEGLKDAFGNVVLFPKTPEKVK